MVTDKEQVQAPEETAFVDEALESASSDKAPGKASEEKPEETATTEVDVAPETEKPEETEETEEKTGDTEKTGDEPKTNFTREEHEADLVEQQRKWQSTKDKELKPVYAERDQLRQQIAELNHKLDDKANEALFAEESEQYGEEAANKTKAARERILKARDEMQILYQFKDELPRVIKDAETKIKRGLAYELGAKHFPGTDAATSRVRADFIEELVTSDADNEEKLTLLARARSAELNNKRKVTHKPAPSVSTGGGPNLASMTADELLLIGEKKAKYQRK